MGSHGLEGCSTPIGAVSTMRGTEVMESLFPRSSGDFLSFPQQVPKDQFWS